MAASARRWCYNGLVKLAFVATLGLAVFAPGCGDPPLLGEVVRLDDASDEQLEVIADTARREGTEIDPALAVSLTAPADGETIPAGTPFTFTWTKLQESPRTPRHGEITGTFMWLRLEGGGLDPTIDVVALTSMTWTPDAEVWARLTATSGSITARMITTVTDDLGRITDGPARAAPDDDVTFTVGE